ncbi:MAG: hypothetical protein RLZZ262_1706 [Bacteroidota bacterium]|jgi:hypothetical protein
MLKTKASGFLLMMSSALILCALMIGCDDPKPMDSNPSLNTAKDSAEEARIKELQKIFFSIPSPVEMASLIKEKGYSFDKSVLSPTSNVDKFTGEARQAINLGIYGADLSYAAIFDQKQVTMEYFASAQKLAKQMGVDGALTSELIERLDKNQENRDSLLAVVSEAYADLNGYLKENKRIEVSALVVAGGWLEALYLSTLYCENNEDMVQRIAEQKYALNNLVDYFEKFGDRPNLSEMKADLLAVKEIYSASNDTKGKTNVSKDSNGTVVIGSTNNVSISPETLKKIATKAQELRKKYITA